MNYRGYNLTNINGGVRIDGDLIGVRGAVCKNFAAAERVVDYALGSLRAHNARGINLAAFEEAVITYVDAIY